jgi:hypothetical protein
MRTWVIVGIVLVLVLGAPRAPSFPSFTVIQGGKS